MSDHDFELRLQRVLRADAERAVRPFDAVDLATSAAAGTAAHRPLNWRPAGWPAIRLALVASLLMLAAVATLWLVTVGAPRQPSLVEVVPSPASSTAASNGPLADELATSTWIAPIPAGGLVIDGAAVTDPFLFDIDRIGGDAYLPRESDRERLPSTVTASGPDELTFTSRPGADDAVVAGGQPLRACAAGEEGRYRATLSPDGLQLSLVALEDSCPSRSAVVARTWTRYLGRPNGGGFGIVDAFDPLFAVELPPGSWVPGRSPGNVAITQASPEDEFLAWKDPQGFNDPCDPLGKGRRQIVDAADFVEYFRALPGFTVDSVTDLQLDGRPAINLRLHANPDASCPAGWLVQWQPADVTGEPYWYLRPGDSDSLYLVDLADATLMFEVLGPKDLEAQIVPTIRLLEDGLPNSP